MMIAIVLFTNISLIYAFDVSHSDRLLSEVISLYAAQDFEELISFCDSIEGKLPQDENILVPVYVLKAWSFFFLNDYHKSIETISLASSETEREIFDSILIQLRCYQAFCEKQNITELTKKLENAGNDPIVLMQRSNYYLLNQEPQKALNDIMKASDNWATRNFLYQILSCHAYINLQRFDDARNSLNIANEVMKESKNKENVFIGTRSAFFYMSALYFHSVGNMAAALENYNAARSIQQDYRRCYIYVLFLEFTNSEIDVFDSLRNDG